MNFEIPIVADQNTFPQVPPSTKLAILLPSARWSPMVRSIIGSLVGVASEEVAILIADNSESSQKRQFIEAMRGINPNIIAIAHKKNIGAFENFLYLFDWSKDVPFIAIMADDDWASPDYHVDAYRALVEIPNASQVEAGTALVDFGDGKLIYASQNSMIGNAAIDRMTQWSGIVARITMYNVSRRAACEAAIQYIRATPLHGTTLMENLWELNKLALGDFIHTTGHGCYVHYPAMCSHHGNTSQRIYEGWYKEAGLEYPFVWFGDLSTAIQCATFLMGKFSPISDPVQRLACGQHVFRHIFRDCFFPRFSGGECQAALPMLLALHTAAMDGVKRYCTLSFSQNAVISRDLIDWFIEVIRVFESRSQTTLPLLSERFRIFIDSMSCDFAQCGDELSYGSEHGRSDLSAPQQNQEKMGLGWLLKRLMS